MGIQEELTGRLELGLRKYNHGVRVDDDTREWETPVNSWLHMAREEDYIRKNDLKRDENEEDDNNLIMHVIGRYTEMESPKHKMLLWQLFNMLNSIST